MEYEDKRDATGLKRNTDACEKAGVQVEFAG